MGARRQPLALCAIGLREGQNPMERSEHSEALVLHERDPLLQFLTARLKLSLLTIVGLAVAVGVISIFGVGAVVSYLIHKEANIFRVFDPEHLHFALVAMFVNSLDMACIRMAASRNS
ncbi:MAG: hypothetical protein ACE5MB_09570 [Anaerolineae bacterium]